MLVEISETLYSGIFDIIEVKESDSSKLIETGIPIKCKEEDNLILKVLNNLPQRKNYKIHLHKNIPIGSGLGIINPLNIKIIVDQCKVPVILDAGIGSASDACFAMELGCDAVLVNSAIAQAKDPIGMAESFKNAVIAGRQCFLSGTMKKKQFATATSPTSKIFS